MANVKEVQTVVPRFGIWNANEDISYSMVFDNARANRGGKIDDLNQQSEYPTFLSRKPPTNKAGKTVKSGYETENSSLPFSQIENKNPGAHSQRTLNSFDTAWGSATIYLRNSETPEKDSRYCHMNALDSSTPAKVPSFHAESRGSRPVYQSQVKYSQSGAISHLRRQTPDSSLGTCNKKSGSDGIVKRSHLHCETIEASYQNVPGRLNSKAANSSDGKKKAVYDFSSKKLASTMVERSQKRSGHINGKSAMPKFGDWDVSNPASAEGFTVIFEKAREERTLRGTQLEPKSFIGVDEDLYMPATSEKSSAGLRHLLCCSSSLS